MVKGCWRAEGFVTVKCQILDLTPIICKYGNTSAASVVIALDEAVQSGRIQRGDLILLDVFGAGQTWAAAVIEW